MYDSVSTPEVTVKTADGRRFHFTRAFHVGRSDACEVPIHDHHVSRKHLLISYVNGQWIFTDLGSSNGVFLDGVRVPTAKITHGSSLRLGGVDGPLVSFEIDYIEPTVVIRMPVGHGRVEAGRETQIARKYFGKPDSGEPVGQHTMLIRSAFEQIQKKQKRRHWGVVAALTALVLLAAGYALYAHLQLRKQQALAEELFYSMKQRDVFIANAELRLAAAGDSAEEGAIREERRRRREDEAKYSEYLESITLRGKPLEEDERLILLVTRRFGECDLVAPQEYLSEVKRFIRQWQSTKRFERAVQAAQQSGYVATIGRAFDEQGLPPHYFYLAMQESSFNPRATGPATRWGYAKGMWQFIPETGKRYGLAIGPRAGDPVYDPQDERHDWEKATLAAARYIKTIYATDAQASGLLVMASYNWGEGRVIDRIRRMPDNPRDRNFWKLLAEFKIPDQTYNYVFHIVAAAVIGENPRLFGFEMDNPLESSVATFGRAEIVVSANDLR